MDLRWLSSILLGASCLAFGYLVGTRRLSPFHLRPRKSPPIVDGPEEGSRKKGKKGKVPLEIEKLADILDDFKMVLVVRNDLKMGKGKIAAQCSLHNCLIWHLDLISSICEELRSVVRITSRDIGPLQKASKGGTKSFGKVLLHVDLKLSMDFLVRFDLSFFVIICPMWRWETCGQPKVVLKIETEEEMLSLQEKAKGLKLPTHITIDAGRTQIAPNSRTVMAILGPVEVVDDVTGDLKLM